MTVPSQSEKPAAGQVSRFVTLQRIADYFGRYFSDSTTRQRKVFRFSDESDAGHFLRVTEQKRLSPKAETRFVPVILLYPLREPFSRGMGNDYSSTPASNARRPSASPAPDFFHPAIRTLRIWKEIAEGAPSHPYRSGRAHSSRVCRSGVLPPHVHSPSFIHLSDETPVIEGIRPLYFD